MDELNTDDSQDKDEGTVMEAVGNSTPFSSGNDEQEYLLATWEKLGVGRDGLLSLDDLSKVCQAIGIEEESIKVIKQLFERLDVDGDGRITFAEFMQIFKNANQSQVFDNSLNQETFDSSNSHVTSIPASGIFAEIGLFHSLDPDGTGFVQVSRLLEIWCAIGLPGGERFLKDLGLRHLPRQIIYLSDLSSAFEEDLRRQEDTKQCGFHLLLHEIRDLRTRLDMCEEEKNKYRLDLNEANQRISHLAQEIDEHSSQVEMASKQQISNLERQYKEQLKEWQDVLKTEEELSRVKMTMDIKEFENRNVILKEEEIRLRQQIALQDNDIRKLMAENVDISDKLKEAERQVEFTEKQIVELRFVERKMAEYEDSSPREDAYKSLLLKVDQLASQNQILRDRNDELLSKVDILSIKSLSQEKEEHSLEGSVIGDYLDSSSAASIGSLKRRSHLSGGSGERDCKIMKKSSDFSYKHINIHYVDVAAYDESFDTSLPLQSDKYAAIKPGCSPAHNAELRPSLNDEYCELKPLDSLASNHSKCYSCDDVIEKLKQLGNTLSFMNVQENRLDLRENKCSETDFENKNAKTRSNTALVLAKLQDQLENGVKNFNSLLEKFKTEKNRLAEFISRCGAMSQKIKRKRVALTRFMTDVVADEGITTIPEEEEVPAELSEMHLGLDLLEEELSLYEEKFSRERDTLEKHKAVVEERNLRIEKDMEIMKSELASSDDYWQMKIKEEQDYYEEERNLYDEKFLELEKKIKEYEVLLKIDAPPVTQTDNSYDSDGLSTIDENAHWEKQYTELEEELKVLQHKNNILAKEKELLKLSHDKERKSNLRKYEDEILTMKLELDFWIAKVRSADTKLVEAKDLRVAGEMRKPQVDARGANHSTNQLAYFKKRNKNLESALKSFQKSNCEILTKSEERHQLEIESQQTNLASTQQILSSSLAKHKDQTVKMYRTDALVKNLYLENTHLMLALQVTEERQKRAEASLRNLEMSELCSL